MLELGIVEVGETSHSECVQMMLGGPGSREAIRFRNQGGTSSIIK